MKVELLFVVVSCDLDAEKQTKALYKSTNCYQLLNYLCGAKYNALDWSMEEEEIKGSGN